MPRFIYQFIAELSNKEMSIFVERLDLCTLMLDVYHIIIRIPSYKVHIIRRKKCLFQKLFRLISEQEIALHNLNLSRYCRVCLRAVTLGVDCDQLKEESLSK